MQFVCPAWVFKPLHLIDEKQTRAIKVFHILKRHYELKYFLIIEDKNT